MNSSNFRLRIGSLVGNGVLKNAFKDDKRNNFAKKIGVDKSMLTNVLIEHNEPSLELIERILLAFPKLSPDWLLFGIEPMFRDKPKPKSKELCNPSAYQQFLDDKNDLLFRKLSESENWEWTLEFIAKHADQLHWKALSYNYELPWCNDLLELYVDKWDWSGITCLILRMEKKNSDATSELVSYVWQNFVDKLDWKIICKERQIDDEFLRKYAEYINWDAISANHNLIWNRQFIETHSAFINWQVFSESSFYGSLDSRQDAFRKKIVHLYGDKLDLFLLSNNYDLTLTPDIIEKYKDKWNWHELINNFRMEWNLEMFEKYDHYISKAISADELRSSYLVYTLTNNELIKYGLSS